MLNISMPDPSDLMAEADAARRKASGGQGGNFIASLLDAVGIGTQVAKPPKGDDLSKSVGEKPAPAATKVVDSKSGEVAGEVAAPVKSEALSQAEAATSVTPLTMTPMALGNAPITPWGQKYLNSVRPLLAIDPDAGAMGIITPVKPVGK